MLKKIFVILIFVILTTSFNYAQTVFKEFPNIYKNIHSGDIVSLENGKIVPSQNINANSVLGIESNNIINDSNSVIHVFSSGIINTYVSNINGNVNKGDHITTSSLPGIAKKLNSQGLSIGEAVQSFNINKATRYKNTNIYIEKIPISINIEYLNLINGASNIYPFSYNIGNTLGVKQINIFQIISVLIILFISIIISVTTIIKNARDTVKKTARNPLAKKGILNHFYFKILIAMSIFTLGIILGYLIIIF